MKKHLIAAAVAGALAVPAMAQVTVYGVIETGVMNTDNGGSTKDTTALADSVVNSSRLGFKGEEDLGGGTKAFFRLESGISASTGTIGKGSTMGVVDTSKGTVTSELTYFSNNNFFDRGAEVGIAGGFGQVKLGKFDVTSAEGVEQSMIGNVGLFDKIDLGSDVNHAIQYKTPTFGGVSVEIGHAMQDGNSSIYTQADLDNEVLKNYEFERKINSVAVTGSMGMVKFGVGYTEQDEKRTDANTEAVTNVESKATTLGAAANLGVANVGLSYGKNETQGTGDKTHTILSAVAPLGMGLNIHGMYAMWEQKALTVGGSKSEYDKYAIALSKDFSKRTTGYAAYVSKDVDGTNTGDQKQIYVGVKHSF